MFKNKKSWIIISVVVIIGLLVGINVWNQSKDKSVAVETEKLSKEKISETIMMPGTLELAHEQNIYFEADKGEIDEVLVKEGDKIEKENELIRYTNEQLVLEEKENELQQRANNLERNNLVEQHREIDKQIEDDPDNKALQEEHDQIKLQQQQANIKLERGKLQKDSIETDIESLVVSSDIEGTVVTVNDVETLSGEELQQKPLIRIGTLNKLIVKGSVSEFDTLEIEEEQKVTLTSEAVPDEEWKGNIELVSYLPETSDGTGIDTAEAGKHYDVEISVEDEIDLKPGFQMLAEIETNSSDANTLPIKAVEQDGDKNYVYIVQDGKAVKKEVVVGTVSTDKIEITEGLTNEDQVIKNPSDKIFGGMDVTVQ